MAVTTKVELSGNFFRRDPGKTLFANIGDMLSALAPELESTVKSGIESRSGSMRFYTGWTRDHVQGYTTSPKTGRHWALWAAVGVPTAGMDRKKAMRTSAAAASIERRFHPFRNAKGAVYRSRAVISANLTKGLE